MNEETGMFVGGDNSASTPNLVKARLFTAKCYADAMKIFPNERVRRVVTVTTLKLED